MTVYSLFGQPALGASAAVDGAGYTMAMQFQLRQAAALTGIWFYSGAGAVDLPSAVGVFRVSDQVLVDSITSGLTWSGAAGSGWIKATFSGSTILTAGVSYKVAVQRGSGGNWYSSTAHYWDTGAGGSGLTSGIIVAPNNAGADVGQDSFNASAGGGLVYPLSSFNSSNYWVDVEVTTASTLIDAITGKLLWLKAKDYATGAVATWYDRSGLSHDGIGYGGTLPAVVGASTPVGGNSMAFSAGYFAIPRGRKVYAAVASSEFSGATTAAQANDGRSELYGGIWSSNAAVPAWLRYQLPSAAVVTSYSITARTGANPNQAPKDFTIEGSNDATSWTTLDTRTGQTFVADETKSYSFANSTAYLYYRLNVSAVNGGGAVGLAEFVLDPSFTSSAGELWMVVKSAGGGVGGWCFGAESGASDETHYPFSGTVYDSTLVPSGSRPSYTPSLDVTQWRIYRVKNDGTTWQALLNQTPQASASSLAVNWAKHPLIGYGKKGYNIDVAFSGNIAEVLAFDHVLTDADAKTVSQYLQREHFLSPSLSAFQFAVHDRLPQLFYENNETTGTAIADSSINGRPGTVSGTPTLGKTSLLADGSKHAWSPGAADAYILRAGEAWMNPASGGLALFTLFKLAALPPTLGALFARDDASGVGRHWALYVTAAGGLRFIGTSTLVSNVDQSSTGVTLAVGTKYAIGMVWDYVAGQVKVYLKPDGGTASLVFTVTGFTGVETSDTSRQFTIGSLQNRADLSWYHRGDEQATAFYTSALSLADFTAIADAALTGGGGGGGGAGNLALAAAVLV